MPIMPPTFHPHGLTPEDRERTYDKDRGSRSTRLYDRRWYRARAQHLARSPLCRYCELQGKGPTAATLVDHLYPHKGDVRLFWMASLWVSSCDRCHSGFKQAIECQGQEQLDKLARRLGLPTLTDVLGRSRT